MKKLHLGAVLFSTLLVGVLIIAAGTGALFGTADTDGPTTSGESPSDSSDSMTVENVSVRNRTADGVLYLDIAVAGELDIEQLESSMKRLYDDPTVNVSTIELVDIWQNVVTVAIVTDDRSSSAHVVTRVEHYLDETNWNRQPLVQADDSSSMVDSAGRICKVTTAFYQIDFVVGEPIEELQGPEGTYLPHELIRFAHGSTDEPIMRLSDGEFITHEVLAERIDSHAIEVEDGIATVTFSIAEGKGPIELSLVSYTKPGPGWSRATEHLQAFVDADTKTFSSGGLYTLRVDLPDAQVGPCNPTAMPTPMLTDTSTVEVSSSKSVQLEVDWLEIYNGEVIGRWEAKSSPSTIITLDGVKPGDSNTEIIRLHNRAGPSYIWMTGELTANDENGANEPERAAEENPGGEGDGELAAKVDVTVYYAEYVGPGDYDVKKAEVITSGSLAEVMADLNDGIPLDADPDTDTRDPYPRHDTGYLIFKWNLPIEVGNEVQSDSVAFSLQWVAQQPHHSDGNDYSNDNET